MKTRFNGIILLWLVISACAVAAAADSQGPPNTWAPAPLAVVPKMEHRAEFSLMQTESSSVCGAADTAQQVVYLTNTERFANGGLPPLKHVDELIESSLGHSVAMAERDFFAHCDLDTKKLPWTRMQDAGYYWNWAGENIAAGYSSPEAVMTGWMNSSGHRANILNADFREIGVGYYYYSADTAYVRFDSNGDCDADDESSSRYYSYWTQNFGRRDAVYPVVINLEAHMTETREVALYVHGEGWASEMRLRNNDGAWSAWQPFSSEMVWNLDKTNGNQTVHVEIRNDFGTVRSASDQICADANDPVVLPDLIFRDGFET